MGKGYKVDIDEVFVIVRPRRYVVEIWRGMKDCRRWRVGACSARRMLVAMNNMCVRDGWKGGRWRVGASVQFWALRW